MVHELFLYKSKYFQKTQTNVYKAVYLICNNEKNGHKKEEFKRDSGMISEKELVLLNHLRKNARKSLSQISKETNIPISTLFELLKRLESKYITKHVSLIDFSKLGYNLKVCFLINSKNKQEIKNFLLEHPQVNTLSSSINDHDFYFECIFKDLKAMIKFKEELSKFGIENVEQIFIIDEVKKEACYT